MELVAILFAVGVLFEVSLAIYSRVRGRALQIACAGNLRRVYQALRLYASDWDGHLPLPRIWLFDPDDLFREISLLPHISKEQLVGKREWKYVTVGIDPPEDDKFLPVQGAGRFSIARLLKSLMEQASGAT